MVELLFIFTFCWHISVSDIEFVISWSASVYITTNSYHHRKLRQIVHLMMKHRTAMGLSFEPSGVVGSSNKLGGSYINGVKTD